MSRIIPPLLEDAFAQSNNGPTLSHWDALLFSLWTRTNARHGRQLDIKVKRTSTLMQWIAKILAVLSPHWRSVSFLDHATTTIGKTIYVPGFGVSFKNMKPEDRYAILSHELTHIDHQYTGDPDARKTDKKPNSFWWFFSALYLFQYLVWLFPVKLAFGRQSIEKHGYQRHMEVERVLAGDDFKRYMLHQKWYQEQFHSSVYAWMATQSKAKKIVGEMYEEVDRRYRAGDLDHLKVSD